MQDGIEDVADRLGKTLLLLGGPAVLSEPSGFLVAQFAADILLDPFARDSIRDVGFV